MQQTLSLYILYFVAKKKQTRYASWNMVIRSNLLCPWNTKWSWMKYPLIDVPFKKKRKNHENKKKLAIVKWNNFTAEDVKTNSCRWWRNRIWGRWADALRALTTKQTCKKFSISCRERKRERKIEMIIVVLSALINLEMVYISKGIC